MLYIFLIEQKLYILQLRFDVLYRNDPWKKESNKRKILGGETILRGQSIIVKPLGRFLKSHRRRALLPADVVLRWKMKRRVESTLAPLSWLPDYVKGVNNTRGLSSRCHAYDDTVSLFNIFSLNFFFTHRDYISTRICKAWCMKTSEFLIVCNSEDIDVTTYFINN